MNQLLSHITKFVSTVIELYPLPFELVTDLHTLNAYLKSYSQTQEILLEGFVNRQVDKLNKKMQNVEQKELATTLHLQLNDQMYTQPLGLNKKWSQMNLQIPTQMSECSISQNKSCFQRNQSAILSQRSGRSSKNDGFKNDRHKFGTRQRNKTQKTLANICNKENVQSNCNLRVENLDDKKEKGEEKSLKFIKSEAQLLNMNHNNSQIRINSTDIRKQGASKSKIRYDSHQSKASHSSSLKIKLKSKPTIDLVKVKQGISSLKDELEAGNLEMIEIWSHICEEAQYQE